MSVLLAGSELIQTVIEAERIGIGFYECLAETTMSTEARNLFARIGEEEKEHARELECLLDASQGYLAAGVYPEEYYGYVKALVAGRLFKDEQTCRQMAKGVQDEAEAAQLASSFERDVILFLHEMRRLVREARQGTVDRLLAGEHAHLTHLHALGRGKPS